MSTTTAWPFGILQNQGTLFIAIAFIVAVAILIYACHLPLDQWLVRVLLGLQLGGAIGNVLDRINQGFVTDFIRMGIPGRYYWPNYNIADSSIVTGVIALVDILWTTCASSVNSRRKNHCRTFKCLVL